MKKFAERLKYLRKEKKLSAKALGKIIKVSYNTIVNWENNIHDIKGEYLIRLAKFFDVTTDYLLGLEYKNLKRA